VNTEAWIIVGDAVADYFHSLSLGNLRRVRVSQAVDRVTFDASGSAFDGDPLFEYGENVVIYKDLSRWFTGRCNTLPRIGQPRNEEISYEIVGPWWWLEQITFEQSWQMYDEPSPDHIKLGTKTRVILGQSHTGAPITSGEQIEEALDWAIARGAPIAKGAIEPDLEIPWDECVDISCAEVIRKMLRWSPDAVTWFDYSANPPVFHCKRRSSLDAVTLPISTPETRTRLQSIEAAARYDLQLPGVVLLFEQMIEGIDGQVYHTLYRQEAGDVHDVRTLVSTIPLAGITMSGVSQVVETADWPTSGVPPAIDLNDKAWWKSLLPELEHVADVDLTIHDAAFPPGFDEEVYPRYLVAGAIHPWMDVAYTEIAVTAKIDAVFRDPATAEVVQWIKDRVVVARFVATDAETKVYQKILAVSGGEPIPSSLAAKFLAAWSLLQYQGSAVTVEEDCAGDAHPGKRLNISGASAELAAMDGLVQDVTEDVDHGRTTVRFGPALQLGPTDLFSLLSWWRRRNVALAWEVRTTGKATDDSAHADLGAVYPPPKPDTLGGEIDQLLMRKTGSDEECDIVLDPDAVDVAPTSQVFTVERDTEGAHVRLGWTRLA
jgi:hypothetical protein